MAILQRISYRIRQFTGSFRPRISADEIASLKTVLPVDATTLFREMIPRDQRHSLNVFQALQTRGYQNADLLAAALLHDAGKSIGTGRRLRLPHRVLIVLMNTVKPGLVQQIASPEPDSWRFPFYLHLNHPDLGARLAQEAGCSERTVALIRRHQDKIDAPVIEETDRLLAQLQAADDMN
ncbi:MAG: hypothetical protein U9R25_09275 [Chloroflexota bacterium]|nr:hypothetical protein [Chloroflexota bacterium]